MKTSKLNKRPRPELPFEGPPFSRLRIKSYEAHLLRRRLARSQQRLKLWRWFTAGSYAMLLIGMAAIVWNRGRLENASKPLLIHQCHVENIAKACAEIQRRTNLRP